MSAYERVSAILEKADGRLAFHCPGCDMLHAVNVESDIGPRWDWNGSVTCPTFSPSILVRYPWKMLANGEREQVVCHSFVRDGKIEYLSDCTHALAGQTVDIPRLEDTDDA